MNETELLTEFDGMRSTIANLVQVIKKYDERIKILEAKTADIEYKTPEQILLDRYTASSLTNRNLNADPKVIAYAAHLYHIKQVPSMRISKHGLLSQSKMHGLTTWDNQHLTDFCTLNNVTDIYKHGLTDRDASMLMTDWAGLNDYLTSRKENEPKQTRLEKALKRVNEQQAKRIDYMG